MNFSRLILIFSLSYITTASSTPLQETVVGVFKILSQLLQSGESSPISTFFSLIQERFLEKEHLPKGEEGEGANTGLWNNLFQNFGLQAKNTPAVALNFLIFLAQMGEEGEGANTGLWNNLFQNFGLQARNTPAVALNFLIFLAQMVGNAFPSKATHPNTKKGKSIFEMVVEQPKVSRLLSTMQSSSLMDVVLSEAGGHLSSSSSDCVLQLLCRTSPIVNGMQTSLHFFLSPSIMNGPKKPARGEESNEERGDGFDVKQKVADWNQMTPLNRLFYFMPTIPDFMSQGELCKKKYPNCLN